MTLVAKTDESVTIGSHLMKGTTSSGTTTWAELCKITGYPDMGGEPNTVEVTDLSDRMQRFLMSVQSSKALTFTANYIPSVYSTLDALTGTQQFSLWFGDTVTQGVITPTGSYGKFTFSGELSVYVNAGNVNGARQMTITIVPSTAISVDVNTNQE